MGDQSLRLALLEISKRCKAVVACRVSPDQKRALVHLVKKGERCWSDSVGAVMTVMYVMTIMSVFDC